MADDHGHGGGHATGHGDAHGGSHGHGASGGHGKAHGPTSRREPLIFALILGGILLVPIALLFVLRLPVAIALFIVLLLVVAIVLAPRIQEIKEYERGVLFDFGRYKKTLPPGWHWTFPLFQKTEIVDVRTQTIDIPPQEVLTKEDISVTIDAVAYFRIVDPKKSVLEIKDLHGSVAHVLHAELRTQIGKLPLQDVLEKTEDLNQHLFKQLKQVEDDWGIKALNVELTDITLPPELEAAFRKKQEALEYKEKLETESRARREALRILTEATEGMGDRTMTYLYMETLKKVADGRASKIVLPLELSKLAHALSTHVAAKGGGPLDEEKLAQQLVGAYLKSQAQAEAPKTQTKTTTVEIETKTEKTNGKPHAA